MDCLLTKYNQLKYDKYQVKINILRIQNTYQYLVLNLIYYLKISHN